MNDAALESIRRNNLKGLHHDYWYTSDKAPLNLKYPGSVGELVSGSLQHTDGSLNYNTHDSSEHAVMRNLQGINELAHEPFIFFEFMQIISRGKNKQFKDKQGAALQGAKADKATDKAWLETLENRVASFFQFGKFDDDNKARIKELAGEVKELDMAIDELDDKWVNKANRVYGGSIALYMPTDIQVNDQIVYNDESRKLAATVAGVTDPLQSGDKWNSTVLSSTGVAAGLGESATFAAKYASGNASIAKALPKLTSWLGKIDTGMGAITGGAAAGIIGNEIQRHTGEKMNPHEYMAYQTTSMRTFTFSWTFLPDNAEESKECAAIIKQFRLAAHATRNDYITLTVPDHLVVSFHGAKDMIRMPPVVIESVGVTYNPNNSSFFKHGNSPVEIALSVGLKEIAPIYKADVEHGW